MLWLRVNLDRRLSGEPPPALFISCTFLLRPASPLHTAASSPQTSHRPIDVAARSIAAGSFAASSAITAPGQRPGPPTIAITDLHPPPLRLALEPTTLLDIEAGRERRADNI